MHHPSARRLGAITMLFLLAGGLLALWWYLSGHGMTWAGAFGAIGAFFVSVLALLVPVLAKGLRGPPPMSRLTVTQAADDLASALQRQWTIEENARQVNDPRPLPVRWAVTPAAEEAMRGVRIGSSGTGRSKEGRPPKLAGSFEDALPMFQGLPSRRLVILGTAGAGKSVLAMKLARSLLAERANGGPVPVIFPADTWDPARSFSEWIADQLIRDHPGLALRVKASTGHQTSLAEALASTEVLPIIDGLDELPGDICIKAVTEINAAGSNMPLILTSRTAEYLQTIAAARPISRAMAIELLPLRVAEAKEYLEEATAPVPTGRWQAVFSRLDQDPGGPLATVLTTPLMLWLTRTVYEQSASDASELAEIRPNRQEVIERHLLEAFVPAVYSRGNALSRLSYGAGNARRWLAFLASDLNIARSQEFYWWRPSTAVVAARPFTVALRAALLFAVAWPLGLWVLRRDRIGLARFDVAHVIRGPISPALLPSVSFIYHYYLRPVYHGLWSKAGMIIIHSESWRSFPRLDLQIALAGAVVGFALIWSKPQHPRLPRIPLLQFASTAIGTFIPALFVVSLLILPIILASDFSRALNTSGGDIGRKLEHFLVSLYHTPHAWLLVVIVYCWMMAKETFSILDTGAHVPESVSPLKALKSDRGTTLLSSTATAAFRAALVWLTFGIATALAYSLYTTVRILCGAVMGRVAVRHATAADYLSEARIWLACTRRMPWRIMRFLSDAHERGVLRQAGSVYQFRHVRLQECLSPSSPARSGYALVPRKLQRWVISVYGLADRELASSLPREGYRELFQLLIRAIQGQIRKSADLADAHDRATLRRRQRKMKAVAEPTVGAERDDDEGHTVPQAIASMLMPGEKFELRIRRHPMVLKAPGFFALVGMLVTYIISAALRINHLTIDLVWLLWGLLLVKLAWISTERALPLFVTSNRVILISSGTSTRATEMFPIANMARVRVENISLSGGHGRVIFESQAGRRILALDYVPYPEQFAAEMSWLISGPTASSLDSAKIDPDDSRPIFLQLEHVLRERIAAGDLDSGAPFLSESALAQEYCISHFTVRRALAALQNEGLILGVPGPDASLDPN